MPIKDIEGLVRRLPEVRKITNIFSRPFDEPQRSYMFEVYVKGGEGDLLDKFTSNNIRFNAKSVSIPQVASDFITHNYMGKKFHYSGKDSSAHNVTITFWDDEAFTVYDFLKAWYDSTNEPETGRSTSKRKFQRSIVINMKDVTDTTITKKFEMVGAFPIEISDIPLSYESSEPIEISATFMFDEERVLN